MPLLHSGCDYPTYIKNFDDGSTITFANEKKGAIWRCSQCNKLWVVSGTKRHCYTKSNGADFYFYGHTWEKAGWRLRLKYWNQGKSVDKPIKH